MIDDDVVKLVRRHAVDLAAVGSRVTCNPAPTDTDADFLVLCSNRGRAEVLRLMDLCEFDIGGSRPSSTEDTSRFKSFKKGDLNFIVTTDAKFYGRFMAATSVAKRLNLLKKSDRVALFHAVLYGNETHD